MTSGVIIEVCNVGSEAVDTHLWNRNESSLLYEPQLQPNIDYSTYIVESAATCYSHRQFLPLSRKEHLNTVTCDYDDSLAIQGSTRYISDRSTKANYDTVSIEQTASPASVYGRSHT